MKIEDLYAVFRSSTGISTDSRTVREGALFFALKGDNFNGDDFAGQALEKAAAAVVVSDDCPLEGENVLHVPDTLACLKALAREHRRKLAQEGALKAVIALTGTNGKTTTKELISAVLSKKYRVSATRGNLNNEIGVPLTMLSFSADTQLAVVEMGASHPGDIASLVAVCEPDYGLITNVGRAHLEGFGSFSGVKAAKRELYRYISSEGKAVFLNVDDTELPAMAAGMGLSIIPYGLDYSSAIVLPADAEHPYLRMAVPSDEDSEILPCVETKLVGEYNAVNVLAALAVGHFFEVPQADALDAIAAYVPSNQRSQLIYSGSNAVVADAYNANPSSMAAALENFYKMQSTNKILMLGSMAELGEDSLQEHVKLLNMINCDAFLVGEGFREALAAVSSSSEAEAETGGHIFKWFPDSEALAAYLSEHPVSGSLVLVKGSRSQKMETVLSVL